MAAQTYNVSGIAALRIDLGVLAANSQLFFTGGVDGQRLRLTVRQAQTGGPFTISSGNCPGIMAVSTSAGNDTTMELVYDAYTNTWNAVPQALGASGAQALNSFTTTSAIAWTKGVVALTGGAAITLTITNPVAGPPGIGNDGEVMWFVCTSAQTHKITFTTTQSINGASTSIQFAGAIGNSLGLVAFGGKVYFLSVPGTLTLS